MLPGHRYETPSGVICDSVTTVLGRTKSAADEAGLRAWRESVGHAVADHILHEAAEIGTQAHELNERFLLRKHTPRSGEYRLLAYR